jgi:hypothetical protein
MSDAPVRGRRIPAPRPTWRLVPLLLWRYGLPLVAVLALLDLAVYALLHGLYGACYGVFALAGAC